MVAQPAGPSRPPSSIEDFLWNLHSVLVAAPSPLAVDSLTDAYSKQLGHKCNVERWLVVGEGGLTNTCKRIPHIVTLYQANGTTCVKATQPAGATKDSLIEADQTFRRELQRKNAAAKAAKAGAPAAAAPAPKAAATNGADSAKRPEGPSRPPATIEDFLWNLHTVLERFAGPLPVDQLKDAYSKHLGHKFAMERFLVVGDQGIAGTLKRIPHVVTVSSNDAGQPICTPTLAKGITREDLLKADQDYKQVLKAKAQAKAKAAAAKATPPSVPAKPAAPAVPAAAAADPAGQTRPSEGGGEPDAKKQKTGGGDAETLSRMLVQGVVRVLQHRAKEGKGALKVSELPEEFKALWKVPFNLASAGYADVNAFLKAWPNKVELTIDAAGDIVSLAKKQGEKGKVEDAKAAPAATKSDAPAVKQPPPAAPKASATAAAEEPEAKKAKNTDQDQLSRMLVQGVVRVLQSRVKEGKGNLPVANLAEEFKTLWKVPFNLTSAGFSDVNAFIKAWPNKLELSADGSIVSLAKKPAEKAPPAAARPTPDASALKPPAPAQAIDLSAPLPTTAVGIRTELTRNAQELDTLSRRQQALVARQTALLEALSRC